MLFKDVAYSGELLPFTSFIIHIADRSIKNDKIPS